MSLDLYTKPQSKFIFEAVLDQIDRVIRLASKFGGRVYGNYVRNVLVPREIDPKCDVRFSCVNFYFRESAEDFITAMGDQLKSKIEAPNAKCYDLVITGTIITRIYIIIPKNPPKLDFKVNNLTFSYDLSGNPIWNLFWPSNKKDNMRIIRNLKDQIMAKQARLSKHILFEFYVDNPRINLDYFIKTLDQEYHRFGWKIILEDAMYDLICPPSVMSNPLSFREWIWEHHPIPEEALDIIVHPKIQKIKTSFQEQLDVLILNLGNKYPQWKSDLERHITHRTRNFL